MPNRTPRFCAHAGCLAVTKGGTYCEAHIEDVNKAKRAYNRGRGSAASQGYDHKWNAMRDWYIARHPLCEDCEAHGKVTPAVLVHHVVPLKDGGERLDPDNLRALCTDCHEAIHGPERWARRHEDPQGG